MSLKIGQSGVTFNDGKIQETGKRGLKVSGFFDMGGGIYRSYGVSSVSTAGTGVLIVNFSYNIGNANFVIHTGVMMNGTGYYANGDQIQGCCRHYYEGNATRCVIAQVNDAGSAFVNTGSYVSVIIHA